jgi:hypothetical protein
LRAAAATTGHHVERVAGRIRDAGGIATGGADDLAGEACSIYDEAVRARLSAVRHS